MNIETEAKIRVERFDEIIQRLESNKANCLGCFEEHDVYFKDRENRLMETGCGLRLRRKFNETSDKTLLTFKGARLKSVYKARPEAQTYVENYDEMLKILTALEYSPLIEVKKSRQLWQIEHCEVCLDEVEMLGRFVEVEGPDEKEVEKVLGLLDLAASAHTATGYARMMSEFLGKQGSKSAEKED